LANITMKELLERASTSGTRPSAGNLKMQEYIFGGATGFTSSICKRRSRCSRTRANLVHDSAGEGRTRPFCRHQEASAGIHRGRSRTLRHVLCNNPLLGGLLTNWVTVQKSVKRLKDLDRNGHRRPLRAAPKKRSHQAGARAQAPAKPTLRIKSMNRLPDIVFVIDPHKEAIAVKEARKLGIPVVAVVDTNCDPTEVDG